MGELRLVQGFIQLPLPFMGARHKQDIVRITESFEMEPWRVANEYDRPIPRRIAEEAGVPRHLFGQSKMASVVIFPPPAIPFSKTLRREFFNYLADENIMPRVSALLWPIVRWLNAILSVRSQKRFAAVYYAERVISKLIGRYFVFKPLWSRLDGALFCYCVNRTARSFLKDLSRQNGSSEGRT